MPPSLITLKPRHASVYRHPRTDGLCKIVNITHPVCCALMDRPFPIAKLCHALRQLQYPIKSGLCFAEAKMDGIVISHKAFQPGRNLYAQISQEAVV